MTARVPEKYKRDRAYPRPKGWGDFYGEFFPKKTCPASRHTYMICDWLRDPHSEIRRTLIDAGYEPDHWASSIEVTVECLWKARRHLEWQQGAKNKRGRISGEWLPIRHPADDREPDICPASGTEAGTAETVKQGSVHEGPVAEGETPQ